ncbi:hypothetical protein ABC977_09025 [Thioalkalicoccus limnaeus]|uniref:DUF2157 domain-containing protein n=1 Tax=Thioalkalicoccus limnaeus TaxID=120681 RepID=A0ABV4BDE7_9GAMM
MKTTGSSDSTATQPAAAAAPARGLGGRFWEWVAFAILYALAAGGLLFMNTDAGATQPLWQVLVGIVAVVAILAGWSRSRRGVGGRLGYLIKSLLHWGALILVLYLLLLHDGHLALDVDGSWRLLVYVLGLGCLLAGLHHDARMFFFGLYLVGAGLLSQGLLDTSRIDISLAEGFSSPEQTIIIGAALLGLLLTAVADLFRAKR